MLHESFFTDNSMVFTDSGLFRESAALLLILHEGE